MDEVKVRIDKRADVFVTPDQLVTAFCPEPGLSFSYIERQSNGTIRIEFCRRDEFTRLVGKETHVAV